VLSIAEDGCSCINLWCNCSHDVWISILFLQLSTKSVEGRETIVRKKKIKKYSRLNQSRDKSSWKTLPFLCLSNALVKNYCELCQQRIRIRRGERLLCWDHAPSVRARCCGFVSLYWSLRPWLLIYLHWLLGGWCCLSNFCVFWWTCLWLLGKSSLVKQFIEVWICPSRYSFFR